jgi:hypothetical protein
MPQIVRRQTTSFYRLSLPTDLAAATERRLRTDLESPRKKWLTTAANTILLPGHRPTYTLKYDATRIGFEQLKGWALRVFRKHGVDGRKLALRPFWTLDLIIDPPVFNDELKETMRSRLNQLPGVEGSYWMTPKPTRRVELHLTAAPTKDLLRRVAYILST